MDVEGQRFPRELRGYAREEVRLYLQSVSEEIERLNLENGTLREELGRLKERLEEFRDRERSLQETLIAAQQMAEQYRKKSQTESELMIKEARIKSEKLLEQAQDQLARIESETSRAKLERDAFENRLRSTIEEHQALLDLRRKERSEVENLRFLRRRSGAEAG
jgi:cell division initiation protein